MPNADVFEHRLVVERTQAELARKARVARSFVDRMVGLLGRQGLDEGHALILPHCRSIHTWFMRFPIDVVFVDRQWGVVAVCETIPAWRISPVIWRAWAAVELPAGTVKRTPVQVGDRLIPHPLTTFRQRGWSGKQA